MRIEGFEGLELIGRGASASVYRARQSRLNRDVALKVFDRQGTSQEMIDAFLTECAAVGPASADPNIATVHGADVTSEGVPYLVMELCDGGSVAELLADGPLPVEEAVRIAGVVASALASAHRLGIVHRDVKPSNIMLTADGRPLLADFGIASAFGAEETTTSQSFTIAYAAPEILRGRRGDTRSDWYGLGATLFAMLDGRPPFAQPGLTRFEVMGAAMNDRAPAVTRDDAAGAIVDLTAGLLASDPSSRPDPAEVLSTLGADDVVSGPTIRTRTARPRRGRWLAAAGGVAAIVIVAVVVIVVRSTDSPQGVAGRADGADVTSPTVVTPGGSPLDSAVQYPGGVDESLTLAAQTNSVSDAVTSFMGSPAEVLPLSLAQYYVAPPHPEMTELPATSPWGFTNPDEAPRECMGYFTEPITMTGFAGRVMVADQATTSVTTARFADESQAADFFTGRSVGLGVDDETCIINQAGGGGFDAVSVERSDVLLGEVPAWVDELNSWKFTAADQVLPTETGAYGFLVREGPLVWEVRVGLRTRESFDGAELSALLADLGPT